jgi:hypothetical protein
MHRTTDNKYMGIQLVQITKQHLLFLRANHGLASIHSPAFGIQFVTSFGTQWHAINIYSTNAEAVSVLGDAFRTNGRIIGGSSSRCNHDH